MSNQAFVSLINKFTGLNLSEEITVGEVYKKVVESGKDPNIMVKAMGTMVSYNPDQVRTFIKNLDTEGLIGYLSEHPAAINEIYSLAYFNNQSVAPKAPAKQVVNKKTRADAEKYADHDLLDFVSKMGKFHVYELMEAYGTELSKFDISSGPSLGRALARAYNRPAKMTGFQVQRGDRPQWRDLPASMPTAERTRRAGSYSWEVRPIVTRTSTTTADKAVGATEDTLLAGLVEASGWTKAHVLFAAYPELMKRFNVPSPQRLGMKLSSCVGVGTVPGYSVSRMRARDNATLWHIERI